MKKNKIFVKEIFIILFLILIICFVLFFFFPVLNKEAAGWTQNNALLENGGGSDKNNAFAGTDTEIKIQKSPDLPESISFIARNDGGLLRPETGDFLVLKILAQNPASADYPVGTVSIRWKNSGNENTSFKALNTEKFKIFVDGFSHNYHINIGENPNWLASEKISELKFELPGISEINFKIEKISLKKRLLPPLDSYINKFFRNNFNLKEANRFFIPAYLGFILLCLFGFSLKLVSKKVLTGKIIFFFATIILIIFSFYYIKNEFFTVKSYYSSFRKNIEKKDFKNTYLGFYDFKKFIFWLDENTPDDADIIVLVRGEQIYIMSEIVYNLYPKDIRFANISGKNLYDIGGDIDKIVQEQEQKYSYLVSLSKDDFIDTDLQAVQKKESGRQDKDIKEYVKNLEKKFVLERKYRESGGFLYKITY